MAQHILGPTGGILVLTMVAMALMSTGSGEVMAVSSIIVYDIYQIYIRPFRYIYEFPFAYIVSLLLFRMNSSLTKRRRATLVQAFFQKWNIILYIIL